MKKASDNYKIYKNVDGPEIGLMTDRLLERDGLYFKDIDGSGEFKKFDDWRLSPEERAAEYVKTLSLEEKLAQLFISDWRMGKYPSGVEGHVPELDESGILDNAELNGKSIFGEQHLPGTDTLLKEWFSRHLILRANPTPEDLTDFLNQLQAVAEECPHFIPVQVASNSRNENAEAVFGMNDAAGVFAAWPGTLGIAAAVKGENNNFEIIDKFADCIKREWNATGLRKGYMYMADCMTDPRWQRSYGTFGEDPELIEKIFDHLIPGIQGSKDGVTKDGVSVTVKHFPGGGARENGFDPHYKAGQWNVYATEGSLKKYHLRGFKSAIKYNAEAIMPYYSKPSEEKSFVQEDLNGDEIKFNPYGFAYNKVFIDDILRKKMGFKGYINSDTGISHNMAWGVEDLDIPERIGFAVTQSGVDVISGLFDNESALESYNRGKNGYYDTHSVPAGYKKEDLVLTDESLDRAVTRTLTELFRQGMFENPYKDPKVAAEVVATKSDWDEAALTHRKSVVVLKNQGAFPIAEGKKIYVEAFYKNPEKAEGQTEKLKSMLADYGTVVESPEEADVAIMMVHPSSGAYFSATVGYLELDLCENKTVVDCLEDGRPGETTHEETTVANVGRIAEIAKIVHSNGGIIVSNVNVTLAWELGNVESVVDGLTVGFDTFDDATFDVMFGRFTPVGKLPITFPKDDSVIAVNKDGKCISPNDVPGFDKDLYMPDSMKDENGKAYAYRDAVGNYYELGFGLTF